MHEIKCSQFSNETCDEQASTGDFLGDYSKMRDEGSLDDSS